MTMMHDAMIRKCLHEGEIVIDPFPEDHQFQPASVDLRLGRMFREGDMVIETDEPFPLPPRKLVLATTVETVSIPNATVARVEGKSSWGRRGLMSHVTAGFIDPGFKGQITLELYNVGSDTLYLTPGVMICQIAFMVMWAAAERPYGHPALRSHYQNQQGPTPPRD